MAGQVANWETLGTCGTCSQTIYRTDTGSITGHLSNCTDNGKSP